MKNKSFEELMADGHFSNNTFEEIVNYFLKNTLSNTKITIVEEHIMHLLIRYNYSIVMSNDRTKIIVTKGNNSSKCSVDGRMKAAHHGKYNGKYLKTLHLAVKPMDLPVDVINILKEVGKDTKSNMSIVVRALNILCPNSVFIHSILDSTKHRRSFNDLYTAFSTYGVSEVELMGGLIKAGFRQTYCSTPNRYVFCKVSYLLPINHINTLPKHKNLGKYTGKYLLELYEKAMKY